MWNNAIFISTDLLLHTMHVPIDVVVATDRNGGIGKDGSIPWRTRQDLKFFKNLTTHTIDPLKKVILSHGSMKTFLFFHQNQPYI